MPKKTRYSMEDKLRVVNRNLLDGIGQNKIAAEEGIARSSINLWVKQFLKGGQDALRNEPPFQPTHRLDSPSLSALELENLNLRIENERLKQGYMLIDGKFILLKKKNT